MARALLDEPVPYELVCHVGKGRETMKRLADKRSFSGPAKVLKLRRDG